MFGHSASSHNYPQMFIQCINDCAHPDFGHMHFCQLSGINSRTASIKSVPNIFCSAETKFSIHPPTANVSPTKF